MGLLDAIRSLVADEAESGGGSPAGGSDTETASDGNEPGSGDGGAGGVPDDPGELVSAFAASEAGTRRHTRLGFALMERAGADPEAFVDSAPDLVDLLTGDEAWSRPAAAVLGHVVAVDLEVAAGHERALVDALTHDDETTRDRVAGVLAALAREQAVAVSDLVDVVAEDGTDGWAAAEVLGVVAAERPGALPVDRLDALLTAPEQSTRGAAAYVLAVLAGSETRTDGDGALGDFRVDTGDGYVSTVGDVAAADTRGFGSQALLDDAVRRIVEDVAPAADCRGVEWAATPMGVQVVVVAGAPSVLVDELTEAGDDPSRVVRRLERDLGFEDPSVDVQAAE